MLIGRTKHILYIKIQTSSDNNRISFFKKKEEEKKKTKILVMRFLLLFVCLLDLSRCTVIKLIVHYYNYQCQLLARWLL